MIDIRKVVFQALRSDPELSTLIGDRIWMRGSTVDGIPQTETPYIVYNFNGRFRTGPSALKATRHTIQVWVHDDPGDYFRIDQILDRVRAALESVEAGNPVGFLEIRFFETGPDIWDDLVKHIVRYSRLQATTSE